MVTELQLYINAKDYMVADIVLIKRDATGRVLDTILIENKLTPQTALTPRQKALFGRILSDKTNMRIKVRGERRAGELGLEEGILLRKDNLIQISGRGSNSLDGCIVRKIDKI